MAFAATIHRETRATERHAVDLDGTLRDLDQQPFDVSVVDLSADGFRVVGLVSLPAGAEISIGLPALGARSAVVIRAGNDEYGCRFSERLSTADLARALGGVVTAPIPFPAHQRASLLLETSLPEIVPYPVQLRTAILCAAIVLSWSTLLVVRYLLS